MDEIFTRLLTVDMSFSIARLKVLKKVFSSFSMQQTSTNTFIDKLMDRTKEQNLSAEISKLLLRQSQAAAAYDSVWVLALAHYELIKQNKTEILLDDLNKALVGLDFNGLTVCFLLKILIKCGSISSLSYFLK